MTNSTIVSRRTAVYGTAAALLLPLTGASAAGTAPTVLTGTQATYSLAIALTAGTPIAVQNVPADGRQLSLLKDYIQRRTDTLAATFAGAAAVISVTNALPSDPLYRFARDANIRVIDIDAALPWSLDKPGVALADTPKSTNVWGGTLLLAQHLERDPHGGHHRARPRRAVPGLERRHRKESRRAQAFAARATRRLSKEADRRRGRRRVRSHRRLRLSDERHGVVRRRLFHQAGRALDGVRSVVAHETPERQRHQGRPPQVATERGYPKRRESRWRHARRARNRGPWHRRRPPARSGRLAADPAEKPRIRSRRAERQVGRPTYAAFPEPRVHFAAPSLDSDSRSLDLSSCRVSTRRESSKGRSRRTNGRSSRSCLASRCSWLGLRRSTPPIVAS